MNINSLLKKESMKLFFMLSGYFLLVLILFNVFKIIKFNNPLGLIQILSLIIPIIIYLILNKNIKLIKQLIVIGGYLFLLIISPFLFNKTYDLTVDGNSYHKSAIAFIKNGWNPIYQSSREFQKNNVDIVKIGDDSRVDIWIDHYPKATWIISAVIYNMTGNIESGKVINFIFSIMLLIISYNLLRKILDKKYASIISLLLVLNPIMISQFFSYYLDGLVGVLFLLEIFILLLINPKEKTNIWLFISLMSIISIFTNLKFTGLVFSGVIAAIYYFYWLIIYRKDKDIINIFKRWTLNFLIIFLVSILVVGLTSYVRNTVAKKNPLYPLIGKDKIDIITTMQPKSFVNKNMFEKFYISLFSKTENVTYFSDGPKLKLPIKVYKSEIDNLMIPDVRIGGFGPLFAMIFIFSLLIFIYSFIIIYKKDKKKIIYILLPLLSILISMILVKEIWWARYVPQLYFFVIISLGMFIYTNKKNKIINVLSLLFIILIIINLFFFIKNKKELFRIYNTINSDLIELQNKDNNKLKLNGLHDLYGYYYVLKDRNIKYEIAQDINNPIYKYNFQFVVENE